VNPELFFRSKRAWVSLYLESFWVGKGGDDGGGKKITIELEAESRSQGALTTSEGKEKPVKKGRNI